MLSQIKIIVFDLDGTLAETKSEISDKMLVSLNRFLNAELQIPIISDGAFEQFNKQFILKTNLMLYQ